MLLRYIVSNFKSIGHSIEFSMLPTEKNKASKSLQKITTHAGQWNVLSRGGLFGPNASGKSSFVESVLKPFSNFEVKQNQQLPSICY